MRDSEGFDLWADKYDEHVRESEREGEYPFAGYGEVHERIFRRVTATARLLPRAWGREGCPLRDFLFEDCSFRKLPEDEVADWRRHGTSSRVPEPHETFEHVEGFRFERTLIG